MSTIFQSTQGGFMRKFCIAAFAVLSAMSFTANAGDAPSIGGNASITATVGDAGIANVGVGASGFQGTAKQAVASVLSGKVGGGLKIDVDIGKSGIVNFGAGTGGAKVVTCQSIGTIGSDCGNS